MEQAGHVNNKNEKLKGTVWKNLLLLSSYASVVYSFQD